MSKLYKEVVSLISSKLYQVNLAKHWHLSCSTIQRQLRQIITLLNKSNLNHLNRVRPRSTMVMILIVAIAWEHERLIHIINELSKWLLLARLTLTIVPLCFNLQVGHFEFSLLSSTLKSAGFSKGWQKINFSTFIEFLIFSYSDIAIFIFFFHNRDVKKKCLEI